MSPSMAVNAKRNQVFQSIMAQLTPWIQNDGLAAFVRARNLGFAIQLGSAPLAGG